MSHSPEPTHQIQKLDPPSDARQPTTTTGPQNTYPITGPDPNIAHPSKRDTTVSPLCHAHTRFPIRLLPIPLPQPTTMATSMHACMYVCTYISDTSNSPGKASYPTTRLAPCPGSSPLPYCIPCPTQSNPAPADPVDPVQCGAVRSVPSIHN